MIGTREQTTYLDLSSCDREPIHLLSAIGSNGALLVLAEPALLILQASSNSGAFLGVPAAALLGLQLEDVFSDDSLRRLLIGIGSGGKRQYVSRLHIASGGSLFDALIHRQANLLIIEFEPSSQPAAFGGGQERYTALTEAADELDGVHSLSGLCNLIAARVRELTGFDRVMVYRFLSDDSGCVLSEDRRKDLAPYLGLRYPASDIPAQARRLYLVNTLRLAPDVNLPPAVLVPALNPLTGTALDMTFCVLRAMSPVHVEYLRNMGVAASMSISIVKDGRLWGLIACHHCEAKVVPHPLRITCEMLARLFSSHIAAAEEQDERAHIDALERLQSRIDTRLRTDREVTAGLAEMADDVQSVTGAQGFALSIRGKLVSFGIGPDAAQTEALLTWLRSNQREHILATERLAFLYPHAESFNNVACGLLSVRVAIDGPDFLLLFRKPVVQVVTWAGNPEKPVEDTEVGRRISPRRSFEKWNQTFRDRAEPWKNADRQFAASLRSLLAETMLLRMNDEIGRLNIELARSNVELRSFSYTASHDLQEPVRTIRAFAQLLARTTQTQISEESQKLIKLIEDGAARMGSLISTLLSYSELGGTERREGQPVPLQDVLRWVLTNLSEQIRESDSSITHDELPVVFGDPNHLEQLLQNVIGNAIKYRRPGIPLQIHISSSQEDSFSVLSVRDNGQGFEPEYAETIFTAFTRLHGREIPGHGVGLATCRKIVELNNGRIWAESGGPDTGATFRFSLPLFVEKLRKSAP